MGDAAAPEMTGRVVCSGRDVSGGTTLARSAMPGPRQPCPATIYGVEMRQSVQAVKRNIRRFPDDFSFQLSPDEAANLRSQSVISSWAPLAGRKTLAPIARPAVAS
jgi:hypothetical protein